MLLDTVLSRLSYAIWSLTSIFTSLEIPYKNITITYTLYTPENPNPTIIETTDDLTINPEYDLKILCHGYYNYHNISTEWYQSAVEAYLKKGSTNVIITNYTYAIKNVKFYETGKYTKAIGTQLGQFILQLFKLKGIPLEKIHIIGHLIGAHVAGAAGEIVYDETGKNIDRITGIEPVSMGYLELQTDGRLSRNDANFVDAIHSSGMGIHKSVGRIDFFGYAYPQNCTYNWFAISKVGPLFYVNSISGEDSMVGVKCLSKSYYYGSGECAENTTAVLGENVDREMFGKFFLRSEELAKYICKTDEEVTTEESSSPTITDE